MRVLRDPWPVGLDTAKMPWRVRTRNVLVRSGLLPFETSLSKVTFGDLFKLRGMGATSVLDFACTSEAAIDSVSTIEQAVSSLDQAESDADKRREKADAEKEREEAQTENNRRNATIRNILAGTASESWSHQVSDLDPRFAPLLPPGVGTVFERIDALFSGLPTAFFSDESALEASIHQVRAKIEQIGTMLLEDALREYLGGLSRVSGARLDALVARFGWGGRPPLTLEEAGAKIKVTRERIRQIQARTLKRVPPHEVIMPALDRALHLLQANAPLSPDDAALLLVKEGVAHRPFHPIGVLEAAAVCGRTPSFEIARVRGRELVVSSPLQGIANGVIHTASIQAGASGVSNVLEVTEECNQNGMTVTESQVRQVLRGLSDAQFLTDDWFWRPNGLADRNRLRNVSRRILSVSSPVSVSVLREGVRREYAVRRTRGTAGWRLVVPPRNVMEGFYRANPEFTIDEEGFVSPSEPLDYRLELSRTDQTLLMVLRSSPACLLDRTAFARGCIAHGMNENTFSVFSSYSPIVQHLGTDMWTLRGVHVDPTAVEALRAANASRPRQKRIVDYGWTPGGSLWTAVRLSRSNENGVVSIPSDIRRYVQGREFAARAEDGSPCGTIRINEEGTSWGFSSFLSRNGADDDDILLVDFHLSDDWVTLRLGSDDLIEEYRSYCQMLWIGRS